MTESEHDLLQETIRHTRIAFETMERLIDLSTKKGMGDLNVFQKRLLKIGVSKTMPRRKKIKLLSYGMKRMSLLCRMNDLRNEMQAMLDDLTNLAGQRKIPASSIPVWRDEYYALLATIYVLDRDEPTDSG